MPAEDASVDHYAALQVSSSAQSSEIKSSYRKLALLYHPDRNHGNEAEANRKFQAIQAAYEVLTDATRRAKYDRVRLAAGYGTVPAATAAAPTPSKNGFTTSTTAARAQAAAAAAATTSNTAKRYTSTAGYASSTLKPESRANDFKSWASGSYASRGAYTYRDTDKEKSRSSDDEKKRRERERERSSKSHTSRAKSEHIRPESPHTPTPRRSHESTSAYAHTYYSREDPRRSRGRSPEPSHTSSTRATTGDNSDPDSYSKRPSRPYSYKPEVSERFTTLRPNSPIPEGRKSDGSRYQRHVPEPPGTYYAKPDRAGGYSRYAGYAEPSRKSRKSEEFEKPHIPPSPPPEKERDRMKFRYNTFHETSDEDTAPRPRRKSSPTPKSTKKSSSGSRNWNQAYAESEDGSDYADDEKASDDRTFEEKMAGMNFDKTDHEIVEEKMAGMNFGKTKDETPKSSSWDGLKEPKPRSPPHASMAPETPRRTPSPYGKSPGKATHSPNEKKKAFTRSSTPPHPPHPHFPPPQHSHTTNPSPGVFAFQVPTATAEPPQPAFDWRNAFSMPTSRPQFAQYQTPVYAPPPTFTPAPPPQQPGQYPVMRPASTQPISTAHKNLHQTPAFSDMDLKAMFENLTPGGLPHKKSEPNLKGRRTRSRGAKPKLTTKFSEMSISGNSSPVKDNASDGSRSMFGDSSSHENLKQRKKMQAEAAAAAAQTASGPMDIDPPAPPQPTYNVQTPLSAKFEPIINGRSTNAADVPLPASPMNGFYKPSATPASSKHDPLSTFHNLANLYPINTSENFGGLNGMANLKDALPFKSQASSTARVDGKSRDEPTAPHSPPYSFPQPPKPPTLPLPIRVDASGKLDNVAYKPYWDDMQVYVDQWRDYEAKMLGLLHMKLEMNNADFKDILTNMKAARAYNDKAKEEKALRDEWNDQKSKFMMAIIECHQLNSVGQQAGTITPPAVPTNTSFLGNYGKSKFTRMPTFSNVPMTANSGVEGVEAQATTK